MFHPRLADLPLRPAAALLLWLALGSLGGLGGPGAAFGADPAPVAGTGASGAATGGAAGGAAGGVTASPSAPVNGVEFSAASLKALTLGVTSSRTLVRLDPRAYQAAAVDIDQLPPGMTLTNGGVLKGVPGRTGFFRFTVQVTEVPQGPEVFRQTFNLRVGPAAAASAPTAASTAATPASSRLLTSLPREAVDAEVENTEELRMLTWRLTAADLAKLKPDEDSTGAGAGSEPAGAASATARAATAAAAASATGALAAGGAPAACPPTVVALVGMLKPLLEVEYPTRALFEAALTARQVATCELVVKAEAAGQRALVPPDACVPPTARAAPAGGAASTGSSVGPSVGPSAAAGRAVASARATASAASGAAGSADSGAAGASTQGTPAACPKSLPPAQVMDALLPASVRQELVRLARKPRLFSAAPPVAWSGQGCGCGPAKPTDEVYGLVPFWLPNQPAAGAGQAAAAEDGASVPAPAAAASAAAAPPPQQVDFSMFTRIGYTGLFLADDGSVAATRGWNDAGAGGLREAQRHGTRLDLVLYRNDWGRLLALGDAQREQRVQRAARETVERLESSRYTGLFARLRPLLLPGWPEPTHLYGGVTVFFDHSPPDDPALAKVEQERFRDFYRRFIHRLIQEMEGTGRSLALNLVVPDQQLGAAGSPFSIEDLVEVLQRTRTLASEAQALSPPAQLKPGGPVIVTRLLVMLHEPTTLSKKALREVLDHTPMLQSHMRMGFLQSVVPVMFYPTGAQAEDLSPDSEFQFDADLVYNAWQFGGVGLWPLPARGVGASDNVVKLLQHNFRDRQPWWTSQASWTPGVCGQVCPHRTAFRLGLNGLLLATVAGLVALGLWCGPLGTVRLLQGVVGLLALGTLTVAGLLLQCDPDLAAVREGNLPLFAVVGVVILSLLKRAFTPRVPKP